MTTDSTDRCVALAGRERWLRPALARMLVSRGVGVVDKGRGTASLRGSHTLVVLPSVVPSPHRGKAVDLGAIGVTLSAAVHDGVQRAVLLSRVGAGDQPGCEYLDSLWRLETMMLARIPKTTVVRIGHPVGSPADPGPFAIGVRRFSKGATESWNAVAVEPLYSRDAAMVLADAVTLDYGRGVLEACGPVRMSLGDLAHLVGTSGGERTGPGLQALRRSRPFRALLSVPSTVDKLVATRAQTDLRDLWAPDRPVHTVPAESLVQAR